MSLIIDGEELSPEDTIVMDMQFETEAGHSNLPLGEFGYYFWGFRNLASLLQEPPEEDLLSDTYEDINLDLTGNWEDYQRYTEKMVARLALNGSLRQFQEYWYPLSHEPMETEPLLVYLSSENPKRVRIVSPVSAGTIGVITSRPSSTAALEEPEFQMLEHHERQELNNVEGVDERAVSEQGYDPKERIWHVFFTPFEFEQTVTNLRNIMLAR